MHEAEDPTTLINEPARVNIGKGTIFAKMVASEDEIAAFFDLTATDLDNLTSMVRSRPPADDRSMHQDFTAFRTFPLIYTRDQKDVATCIDFGFLQEKLAVGLYHTILRSLGGHEQERRIPSTILGGCF